MKTYGVFDSITTVLDKEMQFFNSRADLWWDPRGSFTPLLRYNKLRVPFLNEALKSYSNMTLSNSRILDAGCGGGYLSEELASRGADVVGLDAAPDLIKEAKSHLALSEGKDGKTQSPKKLQYICKDIIQFCKEQQSKPFDAVISSEVIEHVDHPKEFFNNCATLVKPGGVLVVTTPNRTWASYIVMILLTEKILRILPAGTHQYNRFITHKELEKMGTDTGLKVIKTQGAIYIPKPFNFWVYVPYKGVTYLTAFGKPKTG